MKYSGVYPAAVAFAVKGYMKERYGKAYTKDLLSKSKEQYREFLLRVPSVGEPKNPLSLNLYIAAYFGAIYKASEKSLSCSEVADIMAAALKKVKPFLSLINLNTKFGMWFTKTQVREYVNWYHKYGKNYPDTWSYNTKEIPGGIFYELTSCPIHKMCIAEDILELLPHLCELDHVMFSYMHGRLIRKNTIAEGGDSCDYNVYGDKTEVR